jgi:hypothetical protein
MMEFCLDLLRSKFWLIGEWSIEKVFKHHYGRSPYNAALFLNIAQNTSAVWTNVRNKRSAQNAGNGISGLQISNIFWGRMPPVPRSNAPPLENLHPL